MKAKASEPITPEVMTAMAAQKSSQQKSEKKAVKRRRDADQRILDHFWMITDPRPAKRFKSIQMIFDILSKENETNKSNDLMYCLDRIIRGLASARQFARHGFSVLLTKILSDFQSKISLELVFDLSEKHLGKINEVSNHDSVIGWTLVIASILQSHRLSDIDEEYVRKTFDVLYTLGLKKPYIELVVCQLLEQLVHLINKKAVLAENVVIDALKKDLNEKQNKLFFAYICLLISDNFPKLSGKHKQTLKYILKDKSCETLSVMIKESTAYQPSVHPFHRLLVKHLMNSDEHNFTKIWNQCVNETLFVANNVEKGVLGFELIKVAFDQLTTTRHVSPIISDSFVRLFIQSLSVQSHPLHSAAIQLSNFITNSIRKIEDSEVQLEIVDCFTNPPGSLLFDDISNYKFFTTLLKNLNTASKNEWTQRLQTLFVSTDKTESNDILRIRCVQQISSVCKSISSADDIDILWSNSKFFFYYSYFDPKQDHQISDRMFTKPMVPIGEKLRQTLKDGFRSVFSHCLHLGSKTTKEKFLCEVKSLQSLVKFIKDLVFDESAVCLSGSKISEPFHQMTKKLSKLKKRLKSEKLKENEIRVFILLYSLFCVQLFEDADQVINILPDLNECMTRGVMSDETADSSNSPEWADVLTDLILSLLATTSKFTSNILISGFRQICHLLTDTGLQSLIDAINPSNDQQLFADVDASDDEDLDEEENEAKDSHESDACHTESSDDDDDDHELNDSQEVDEKFRNEVLAALGPAAQNDDDEESIYLSDNEMFQIDESLANVFRTKFSDKKKSLEKQQSILIFRTRCLELIEILLKHQSITLNEVFQLIDPMIALVKSSQSPKQCQQLNKAINVISQMTKIKDLENSSLDTELLKSKFDNLVALMSKTSHTQLQSALHSLIIWIISLSKKLDPTDDWYSSPIRTSLESFFTKNNCQISPNFFKNLLNIHKDIGVQLLDTFTTYAFNEDIRPFQKSIAVEMLSILSKDSLAAKNLVQIRDTALQVLCNELSDQPLIAQYVNELLKLVDSADKELRDDENQLKDNHFARELSSKLKSLKKKQKKNLSNKHVIKRIVSLFN